MQVLKLGSKAPEVKAWKMFLQQQHLYNGSIDDVFDASTVAATRQFQTNNRLDIDGKVGNNTLATAMLVGFRFLHDAHLDENGADFPPLPDFSPLVKNAQREAVFGKFTFIPSPIPGSKENIKIIDNWQKDNIIEVPVPQISNFRHSGAITFHKKAAFQLQKLWQDWEIANLLDRVIAWGGSYNPRFVRGSTTTLSNHAFGSAFDINVQWNLRGQVPALIGQTGCVRELVQIANQNGFFWGGHYSGTKDGMHFEIAKII